jgi:hypothetical protein
MADDSKYEETRDALLEQLQQPLSKEAIDAVERKIKLLDRLKRD